LGQPQIRTTINTQVWVIYGICTIIFLVHRYLIRPWIIIQDDYGWLLVIMNSLPNFLEGIVGTMLIAGIGLSIRVASRPNDLQVDSTAFFHVSTLIAAVYVVSQETNLLNVTRPNVYDPFDLLASLIGLVIINRLLIIGGMITRTELAA